MIRLATDKLNADDELCFLCFGGEDWWYHNHGHIGFQLMRRLARTGKVLYVNSIVMQKPNFHKGGGFFKKLIRKSRSIFKGLKKVDDAFWVYSPFSLPVHHIPWLTGFNERILRWQVSLVLRKLGIKRPVILVGCPAACKSAVKMKKRCLLYQRTDLYEAFPSVDEKIITGYDRQLKAEADITYFVNKKMFSDESSHCRHSLFLDHGVDFEMFASPQRQADIPDDMRGIKGPVIGYFGAINSHTVDIDFIERVAEILRDMSFVLVGGTNEDYVSLRSRPNVWMLGKKSYDRIPVYGKCFDVAIMAWQKTAWIDACNPVKLKEYLALGKPVVSTSFAELEEYLDVVYAADTPERFAECIKQALAEDSPGLAELRRRKVRAATWESKAEIMLQEVRAVTCR
ncbi:MAG TPA: glycosyltransferase [Phycisphaerales bacterium]|nr:glycosyltransferase [Phycisphaerales bacterium]